MRRAALVWTALLLAALACAESVSQSAPPPDASAPGLPEATGGPSAPEVLPQPSPTVNPLSPAITEQRTIRLDYPLQLRPGDSEIVRLDLDLASAAESATALFEGHEVESSPIEIPSVYDTHDVLALGRLTAAGLQVEPGTELSEPLLPGQPVSFQWSLAATEPGDHIVTVSLRLRFTPKAGGAPVERTYWAKDLHLQARNVFGLRASTATLLGTVGSAAGTLLGFPYLKELLDWIRGRRPKSGSRS